MDVELPTIPENGVYGFAHNTIPTETVEISVPGQTLEEAFWGQDRTAFAAGILFVGRLMHPGLPLRIVTIRASDATWTITEDGTITVEEPSW